MHVIFNTRWALTFANRYDKAYDCVCVHENDLKLSSRIQNCSFQQQKESYQSNGWPPNLSTSGDSQPPATCGCLVGILLTWGQDYKEKHKTRLKTNVKRTVQNNTKLRHFWAQIVSWTPIHARKTFIILAPVLDVQCSVIMPQKLSRWSY